MAKLIEGVYERVMACAKQEFLDKGYMEASLRVIAKNANTSTGSIYTRFHDKAGLFREIVEPASNGLKQIFQGILENFEQFDVQTQQEELAAYSHQGQERMLDYMYEQFDEFRLLLDASYGTQFQHFLDELVNLEVDCTYRYMNVIGCSHAEVGTLIKEFIHMVTTAYFNGMFEVIRHKMKKEDANRYIGMLEAYHKKGFDAIFLIKE